MPPQPFKPPLIAPRLVVSQAAHARGGGRLPHGAATRCAAAECGARVVVLPFLDDDRAVMVRPRRYPLAERCRRQMPARGVVIGGSRDSLTLIAARHAAGLRGWQ